jgi:hypothetical protein
MDSETEYTLTARPAAAPATTGISAPAENGDSGAREIMTEQENIAGVDTCIDQATEALRTGRESVARSFFAQKPGTDPNQSSDPRNLLKEGRQRVLDQMNGHQTTTPKPQDIAENGATLNDLNRQLGDQIAKLTGDVTESRIRPEVFRARLRATLDTYRTSAERVFSSRVTINVR